MPKFPARLAPLVFAAPMSCVMALIVTCAVTFANTGIAAGFPDRRMHAFLIAWPVAGTCIALFRPHVQRLVGRLVAT